MTLHPERARKYRNKPQVVDGIRLDSKLEARRYGELKLLEKAGEIGGLAVHPRYQMIVNDLKVCEYVADFHYFDNREKRIVVEDTKGVLTPDCRIKLKLMKAIHGIDVRLIKKA